MKPANENHWDDPLLQARIGHDLGDVADRLFAGLEQGMNTFKQTTREPALPKKRAGSDQ